MTATKTKYKITLIIIISIIQSLPAFPCGSCICTNTVDDIKYAMYCMGDTIMDNFTTTINHDIVIKIYALNLIDTPVKTMSENFENWTQLESINLSGNVNLDCSFHDRTPDCIIVNGQCVNTTFKNTTFKTSNNSSICQSRYGVTVIISAFVIILLLLY